MFAPKNKVIYDKDFIKDVRKLPAELQEKFAQLLEIIQENAFDPRLRAKPLSVPLQGMFSFRITRDYRVGFKFIAQRVIQLLVADKRDKIYKRLRRKM